MTAVITITRENSRGSMDPLGPGTDSRPWILNRATPHESVRVPTRIHGRASCTDAARGLLHSIMHIVYVTIHFTVSNLVPLYNVSLACVVEIYVYTY